MSLSTIIGEVVGLGLTPFMVPNYEYITRMNIIWFAVATLGLTVSLSKVNVGIWETLIKNFKDIK